MLDFEQGFLNALATFGISGESSTSVLPELSQLIFVNCAYYTGGLGEGSSYLNDKSYVTVFSSRFNYVPKKGGIVLMGAYQLEDWDYWGNEKPQAMLKITADNKIIFEGNIIEFFTSKTPEKPRAFSYQSSFNIEAKRLNLTNGMALELYQTMIIGYR